jgi:hypothetical protein
MLPLEAIELDAFRRRHEHDTFWCGLLLGGYGGAIDHEVVHRPGLFPVKSCVLRTLRPIAGLPGCPGSLVVDSGLFLVRCQIAQCLRASTVTVTVPRRLRHSNRPSTALERGGPGP